MNKVKADTYELFGDYTNLDAPSGDLMILVQDMFKSLHNSGKGITLDLYVDNVVRDASEIAQQLRTIREKVLALKNSQRWAELDSINFATCTHRFAGVNGPETTEWSFNDVRLQELSRVIFLLDGSNEQ